MRHDLSRLSTVSDFYLIWRGVCHFLLVINSNLGRIFHRFRDMASFPFCSYFQSIQPRLAVDMKFPVHIHIHIHTPHSTDFPWISMDIFMDIHGYIHIHRRLTGVHAASNFCKMQQCKSVYPSPPEKHDTDISYFKLLKNKQTNKQKHISIILE